MKRFINPFSQGEGPPNSWVEKGAANAPLTQNVMQHGSQRGACPRERLGQYNASGNRLTMEVAIDRIAQSVPSLIAIDGLPCSGKSTMAERLRKRLSGNCIELDEFVLPERDWPKPTKPAFPFEYIRYAAFLEAVQALAKVGVCSFEPFDWSNYQIARIPRTVTREAPVIIEGVSSLNAVLSPLFDVRVFVESDRATTLQSAIQRGVGKWESEWRELFLPSVDLYMATEPQQRADILVIGRGVS